MGYNEKGECRNAGRTHFKKGNIPWNKGKILVKNTTRRRQLYYRNLINVEKQKCNRCEEKAKLVHHKDYNKHNNLLDNLEPMCYGCHAKEHNIARTLPQDGGWSKRRI